MSGELFFKIDLKNEFDDKSLKKFIDMHSIYCDKKELFDTVMDRYQYLCDMNGVLFDDTATILVISKEMSLMGIKRIAQSLDIDYDINSHEDLFQMQEFETLDTENKTYNYTYFIT